MLICLFILPEKPSNTHQPTIEELEDKDADSAVPKKKKPKKKKKKRPAHSGSTTSPSSVALGPPIPAKPTVLVLPSPTKPGPAPKPVTLSQSNVFGNIPPQMSTTSLSLPTEPSIAQSARSYIQAESLDVQKSKIKSRPDHASLFSDTPGKKGFLSKLGMGRNKDKVKDEAHKGAKHSWFARLSKKTRGYMHQLLNTSEDETKGMAPMKWEHFLKVSVRVPCRSLLADSDNLDRSCGKWALSTIRAQQDQVFVLTHLIRKTRYVCLIIARAI